MEDLVAVPDIEENIPLPRSATEALPDLTPVDELNMRARTIELLAEMRGEPLVPDLNGQRTAEELARRMMEDPTIRPEYAKYPNDVMAYLAGLVAQSNCMIVDELSDLKMYVVNKLVMEVEKASDGKTRIMALKALGDVDGVDAFKKRTEVTMQMKPIHEVEEELKNVLDHVEYRVLGEKTPENALPAPSSGDEEAA